MNFEKLKKELPKYQIRFSGLSILPFALKLEIYYLPLEKKVGEIVGYWGRVSGYLHVVEPNLIIEFKDGEWKFELRGIF